MSEQPKTKSDRELENLIIDLCGIILVDSDTLNREEAKRYIDSLSDNEIKILNKNNFENLQKTRTVILTEVLKYLAKYQNESNYTKKSPFVFAEGATEYSMYCRYFREEYKNTYTLFPHVLKMALTYIQDITDYFRIFTIFYEMRNRQIAENMLTKVEKIVEDKTEEKAARIAEEKTKNITKKIVSDKVNEEIGKKMIDVSKNISETSVTILGIFAGIVLTIVAGLFYSSAVMESVSSTSIYKLFLIATVVGFVCVNIIAVMFDYIDKIRLNNCKIIRRQDVILIQNPKELKQRKREQAMNELKANVKRHMFIIIIDAILLILMVFAIWKYDYSSDEMSNVTNSQQEDVNKKEQNDNIFVPTDEPVISITPIFSDENGDIISEETEISTLE